MLLISANIYAQKQVATLNHDGEISVYYGENSLLTAHSAAVAGDVITLSPGTFNACVITKPITLRGAGCEDDSVTLKTEIQPYRFSYASGSHTYYTTTHLTLDIPEDSLYHFTMEGIYVGGSYYIDGQNISQYLNIDRAYNPQFIKCKIYNLSAQNYHVPSGSSYSSQGSDHIFKNATFIDCYITNMTNNWNYTNVSLNFINSYVEELLLSNVSSYNSYLKLVSSSLYNNLYAYNSIVQGYTSTSSLGIGATSLLQNCIAIRLGSNYVDLLKNMSPYNNTNMQVMSPSDIFETEGFYVLKEEIVNTFLGDDGTEVGIHGGLYPYNTKPNYMVIKNIDVADKATSDGKLNLEIELTTE